ncbi:polysaccharide deacetylase family protein [Cohnella sp. CFH 77786]|uniref:polysaccharide deacetylase family protein n=1 Tax=Cohnella sp. CFH 77786 TaxID=2662265 RepID=UPI001C60FAD7|nr:polysaccharide deacetylase family protein [Cohnella sp. CFH 77786]MBW5444523.1 polysaccharide deacetylase family protein [Cohnella sp. CFH 77786]
MRMKSPGGLAALLACLSAVWIAGAYGPLAPFVQAVKHRDSGIVAFRGEDRVPSLREWVEQEAAKRRIEPSNAVNDRVWKAIPGYDGRAVDAAATYVKAKSLGLLPDSADFPWVYRDIPPAVGLDDLPLQPIYRGNPAKPMVALMINVAWGDEYLPSMLETLDAENVKATFFLDGSWLSRHMETAKNILNRGHELSNHAYTHPNMSALDMARQRREIGRTEELLKKLGVRNRWFAPPSGDYDARTVKAAGEFGLRTVLWTLDTLDWRNPPASAVVDKIARRIGPGQLVLMHPTSASRDALKGMIASIRAKGYRLGTVTETLSSKRVEPLLTPRF